MPRLRAIRPVACDAGRIKQGEVFDADPETALHLESIGLAERVYEPPAPAVAGILDAIRAKMLPPVQNKMLKVEENKGKCKKGKTTEPAKSAPQLII